jgi:hypothetical protein
MSVVAERSDVCWDLVLGETSCGGIDVQKEMCEEERVYDC